MTFGPVSGMLPWEVPWDLKDVSVWMQGLDDVGVPEEYMADLPASAYWLSVHIGLLLMHSCGARVIVPMRLLGQLSHSSSCILCQICWCMIWRRILPEEWLSWRSRRVGTMSTGVSGA